MQAYEFDGIKNIDGIQKFQYHPICNSERNGELAISANVSSFFEELTKKLSDIYGNGWRNNLEMIVLWSPEFSSEQKSSFKQILLNNGVENFDFYEPKALSNYLLQRSGKFNKSCSYAINLWANSSNVYIQLFHYTEDGQYKYLGNTVAEKAAEDPRILSLTKKMMAELSHIEDIDKEEPNIRDVASNFIKSGRSVSNVVVTLSSGYTKIFTLTNEYRDCSSNGADILNKSLSLLLSQNHLNEPECQIVLSANFVERKNLSDVVTRMFRYVCDENSEQEDAVFQAAFRQMEYTIKVSKNLQQRIAFCGEGSLIDRPVYITWNCPKCGYSCECIDIPEECPNCHGNDIPDNIGNLTIDAIMHETITGGLFKRKKERRLEITITPINGGISAKLLLIVGKRSIGVYNSNIAVGRWTHEFPKGIHEEVSVIVTQDEYPELAQSGAIYIDVKPHYTYQDVNAFVVKTKRI